VQCRYILACASEHCLLIVALILLLLGSFQVGLRLINLHFLEHLLISCTLLEILFVPLLKGNEQFLFVDIDLRLCIMRLLLVSFEAGEHISVLTFEVLLLSEHHKFLFVNHVFNVFLVKFVIISHLVAHRSLSALLLLAIKLGLNLIDRLLSSVQLVSDIFDLLAVILDSLAQPNNVVFNCLAF